MNTVSTPPGRTEQQHPPSPSIVHAPRDANRVGLIDRVALRVGVALVVWSRRPRMLDHREHQERRLITARKTEQRERTMHRTALLMFSPR